MAVYLDLKVLKLDNTIRRLLAFPHSVRRVRISAAKSTGFELKERLAYHILRGTEPELEALTKEFKSRYFAGPGKSKFRKRSKKKKVIPVKFLHKFTRYRVDREGTTIQILFQKSKKKERPGVPDPKFKRIVTRLTEGWNIYVTGRMRRFFAYTAEKFKLKRVRKKTKVGLAEDDLRKQGYVFFPFSKERRRLIIESRPIIEPFLKKERRNILFIFKRKFLRKIRRLRLLGKR